MMLETLSDTPWADLKHAYGDASDVPGLIRSLLSSQHEERIAARNKLGNAINHQASVYRATPYVIPFLFELIRAPDVEDRHLLIYDLVSIAVGLNSDHLPYGFNLAERRRMFEVRAAKLSEKQRSEFSTGPHIISACYESVNSNSHIFVSLLSDDVENVRVASAFALSWFPEFRDGLSEVKKRLETLNHSQPKELADFALSYGLLSFHSGEALEAKLLTPLLDHPRLYVRVAGAIGLASAAPSKRVVEVLLEGARSDELCTIYQTIPFNEGDLQDYAHKVLDHIGGV